MTRKGSGSLVGLFSRLLPSNRPEQGNTHRDEDDSGESAYIDLGIKPEELTQWNIAEDLSPHRRAELLMQGHRRTGSLRLKKLRGDRNRPEKPEQKVESMTAAQVQALLDSKERTRKQRRQLKASGDFLPVAGYDPQTGDWNALTPTDTLSSDTTSPSADEKLNELAQNVKNAKKAYSRAKDRESAEREKMKLEKAQAKLAKIERRKNELKLDDGTVKWTRHGRHWSSAMEPTLSPIAQSLISSTDETAEEPSFYGRARSLRISRKGSPLKMEDTTKEGGRSYSEDTTIHTPAEREANHVTFASPVVTSPDDGFKHQHEVNRDSKNPFLWVGWRRSQVLERLTATRHTMDLSNMEGMEQARSQSLSTLSDLRHFIDLKIPDCHLDIIPREEGDTMTKIPPDGEILEMYPPPDTPETMGSIESSGQSSTTSAYLSDLSKSLATSTRSTSGATATSSLSKSKEHMKQPSDLPRLGPSQWDTELTESLGTEQVMMKLGSHMGVSESTERSSEEDTIVPQTTAPSQIRQIEAGLEDIGETGEKIETGPLMRHVKYVSIPTITTTGCDHSLVSRLTAQSPHDCPEEQTEGASAAQQVMTSMHAHGRSCMAQAAVQDQMAATFPQATPSRGLQSLEQHLETPKIGIASSRDKTPRKSYLRECSPKITRGCHSPKGAQKAGPYQSSNGNLQEAAVQAAARTAMWKSRAGATGGQSPPASAQTRSPHASLLIPSFKTLWVQTGVSKKTPPPQQQQHPLTRSASAVSADIDAHSKSLHPNSNNAIMDNLLAAGFAWWNFSRPAFEQQSGLWRRRHKQVSTFGDLVVFLSAGLFCATGAVMVWYGLRLLMWLLV
ncbi:hypothetical protein PFICI_04651 [Pestalotiopsis fici W106-1]|uniref:Uncharacterized protein n=1 Tax=Pestalotiopsis fici (strain W106-1 / CGMCC3.15140) TaxID=1229662 RepID=W3X9P6_PESFW|nr:uncharacterized protein PFICI_04651 [Pestalotiopsis fici W106-1]ETS82775.1 hypothetical protein PFICI_04651 [Pestalotiopsis fici W106-1]